MPALPLLLSTSSLLSTRLASPRGYVSRGHVSLSVAMGNFEIDLFSPARVSIFTRVLQKHSDGCHEIASLHQAVNVGDRVLLARIPADRFAAAGVVRPSRTTEPIKQHAELTVSRSSSMLSVTADDPEGIPLDESNLVVRALVRGGNPTACDPLCARYNAR